MNQVQKVVRRLAQNIGSPRAKLVEKLVSNEDWTQLQQLKCKPSDYSDGESFFYDSVLTDLLRKCDLPTAVDKEAVAVRTFFSCEAENHLTNQRLSRYLPGHLIVAEDLPVLDFISQWRKDISDILGNLPETLTPRFSGGATYADTGKLITIPDKMSSTPTIYEGMRCMIPLWDRTSWQRAVLEERPSSSDPRTVRGNIFFTVPKDGKTFRGCCKEASLAVSFQLAVGHLMKNRLLRIGIDLRRGQQIHQKLARAASVTGSHATIDMSNASDTVCRVLPQLTLRSDWWELLNSLRATHTRVQGKWVRLEKFSSMGNGFTFELESLIFVTLARTIVRLEGGDPLEVKCYGDDLIVPSSHTSSVMAGLRMFGFTPNMNKTFVEGPFRESCGGDFWEGKPVRAAYLDELPDEPQKWISLANGLRRICTIDGTLDATRWSIIRPAWFACLDAIPGEIRACRGPSHLGDIVIHDEPENWSVVPSPSKKDVAGYDSSWDDLYVRAWVPVPVVLPWHHWKASVQLASCTLGLPSTGVTPKGSVAGFRHRVVSAKLTSDWLPSCF